MGASTRCGSVVPSWLLSARSSRCGSRRRSMTRVVRPLCTVSASKSVVVVPLLSQISNLYFFFFFLLFFFSFFFFFFFFFPFFWGGEELMRERGGKGVFA